MTQNLILAHGLMTDGAVVSASSEASASLDADYVITKQPSERWRATGCASEWVQVVLARAEAIDLVAVIGNFSPFAEIDILAAAHSESLPDTPAWSVLNLEDAAIPADASLWPTLDLDFLADSYVYGLEPRERVIRVYALPAAETWRAWRVVVRDPCNPAGAVEVNRLLLAAKWQPGRNTAYGRDIAVLDDSAVERSMGGSARVTELGRLRRFTLTIPVGTEAEMLGEGLDLDTLLGRRREILLLSDPEASTHFQAVSVYGFMAELSPVQNVSHGRWSKRFAIEELV